MVDRRGAVDVGCVARELVGRGEGPMEWLLKNTPLSLLPARSSPFASPPTIDEECGEVPNASKICRGALWRGIWGSGSCLVSALHKWLNWPVIPSSSSGLLINIKQAKQDSLFFFFTVFFFYYSETTSPSSSSPSFSKRSQLSLSISRSLVSLF